MRTADRQGTLVVDTLHFNHFLQGELEPLLSKVTRLGYDLDFFGDRLAASIASAPVREAAFEDALRGANSLLVVAPVLSYSVREADLVRSFVDNGGRVLIAGDPTRVKRTNSLVSALGINYENDFLYNVVEHETNYRNVIYRDFAPHQVTSGLSAIVLYTANSITGAADPLVVGDANTHSSVRETGLFLSPVVTAMDGRVVALGDASFIQPPYDQVLDNDLFLTNLAEFLTTGECTFHLQDFPFFFSDEVDVVMTSPELLDAASSMVDLLSTGGRRVGLAAFERQTVDTVFVGLYEDRSAVSPQLQAGGIVFAGGKIRTAFAAPISEDGTGLLVVSTLNGRHVLVAIAASGGDLDALIALLGSGAFTVGIASPEVGLYALR